MLALDRALQEAMPYLFALLGVHDRGGPLDEMDSAVRRRRTRDAIRSLIHRESVDYTLLLIFEDLHWIDAETQSLLDLLAESIGNAHILMMLNYRPEYEHHWGNKTYYTQLRLDPLGPARAAELLHELLGEHPTLAPLLQRLIARTEGNPFFLEESVRTLVETGVLVGARGAYHLAQPLESLQVPATVHAVLAARI